MALSLRNVLNENGKQNDRFGSAACKIGLGVDSDVARWAIKEIKEYFDTYKEWIHSVVLFGSYALGQAGSHSDVDFLVLLKKGKQVDRIRKIIFDFRLNLKRSIANEDPVEIQIVDFDEKGIEHIFELSTPLAHAARHGVVIRDDGWFKTLLSRPYPKWPTKEASIHAFTQWIVWMYYRCAIHLKHEMLTDHAPEGLCTQSGRCVGHFSGDILARVISRMLYVTLPARGLLPLCKPDVVRMAEVYGKSSLKPVVLAMDVLRNDRAITYCEFQVMMPFARKLFRECIRICGPKNQAVIKALRREADIYRRIKRDLKNCNEK
ncbi:MAG: nucleotidyltransferase domain-containing protein [Deltaproteobacteria bacterium]|nr:nucleotidyltransferase domain-containing protein [Deltaproteobacteria bacterium]MBW2152401.1 nucleotidyltransferase domain-containing protein [Deltaproteobacteria bacterium]